MPTRDFAGQPAESDPDPITFTVAGREFRCLDEVPAAALPLLNELGTIVIPDDGDPGYRAAVSRWALVAVGFIRGCIVEPDEASFDQMITTVEVDPKIYAEIVAWLAGEYNDRIQKAPTPATATAAGSNIGQMDDPYRAARDAAEDDPILANQIRLNQEQYGLDAIPEDDQLAAFIRMGGGGIS
jgi:hypothetical protein